MSTTLPKIIKSNIPHCFCEPVLYHTKLPGCWGILLAECDWTRRAPDPAWYRDHHSSDIRQVFDQPFSDEHDWRAVPTRVIPQHNTAITDAIVTPHKYIIHKQHTILWEQEAQLFLLVSFFLFLTYLVYDLHDKYSIAEELIIRHCLK